jgi:hypothetical protein
MSVTRIELIAYMDDGTELLARADQRDMARWEVQPFSREDRPVLRLRYLAWSALKRQGLYGTTFDTFNERDCMNVDAPDEPEGNESLDPGKPVATGEPSSI